MKIIYFIIAILSFESSFGQVSEDIQPINPYYLRVQYALLPEPENNRNGIIFYTCDTNYINAFVRDLVQSVFEKTKDDYSFNKFKKNKFRFSFYRYVLQEIRYGSQNNFLEFTDTVILKVVADKFKRKWSWKQLKFKPEYVAVDTIYSGTISTTMFFDTSKSLLRHLVFTNPKISLLQKGQVAYINELSCNELPAVLQGIPINFDDYIVRANRLFNSINNQHVYIKFEKAFKSVLFYFPF